MRKLLVGAMLSLLLALNSFAQEAPWPRYVPDKKHERGKMAARAQVFTKSKRFFGGGYAIVTWVTDGVARAVVSIAVDNERMSAEQAEAEYQKYRAEDEYVFFASVSAYTDIGEEALTKTGLFLQRAEDTKIFVRGTYDQRGALSAGLFKLNYNYFLRFPKKLESGEDLVRSLDDQIEISLLGPNGPMIGKFKVKDLVTRLEDL